MTDGGKRGRHPDNNKKDTTMLKGTMQQTPLMISGMLGGKLAQFTPLVEKKHLKRQNKDKHLI